MANIITQSEYEKMFGVKPFAPTGTEDTIDTKPTPVILTQSEWRKMNSTPVKTSPLQNPIAATRDKIKDVPSDIKDFWKGSVGAVTKGMETADEARQQVESGEISPTSGTIKTIGGGMKAGANVTGEAFLGALKLFTTPKIEEYVAEKAGGAFGATGAEIKSRFDADMVELENSSDPVEQKIGKEINSLIQDYKTNPDFKAQVDGYGGITLALAEVFGIGKGKDVVVDSFKNVSKQTDDVVTGAGRTIRNRTESLGEALDARTQKRRQQELFDIESNYSKLRKNKSFSSDENAGSRARIADAPIWDDVVDTDGKMTTMGKGGAYEQYQRATIDGRESIVRDNLVREGATVNVNELARALKTNIFDSGLEGNALENALKGVAKEIAGLSRRADEFGNIPLQNVQDFKTSATKNINYLTDNTPTITLKKTKARTYKEVIENKSNVNVEVDGKKYDIKGINAELAKYMRDLELIKNLDGRKVKGGKLGKYFAQVSGNLIGGAAGSAVGGPFGMAAGTVLGGEAAGLIKGRSMAGTLGKGGRAIPANPVLDAARKEAGLPPVKDLKTPDKPVGVSKGVPKTKEITKVEGQIKNNVKQQKVAIKDGNFGLVAELKEVYAYLVIKLKELVKFAKENAGDNKGAINPKRVKMDKSKKKLTEDESVAIVDALMDYDATPITVKEQSKAMTGGQIDMLASSPSDERLFELQIKNNKRELSQADLKEANELLIKVGAIADPQSKSLGKRNTQYNKTNTTSKTDIPKSNTKDSNLIDQPRNKGKFASKGTPDPKLRTNREVPMKDVSGAKFTVPKGTVIEPKINEKGQALIKVDGSEYIVPKNQYDNLKGQSIVAKAEPFAPELDGMEVSVRDGKDFTPKETGRLTKGLPTKYSQYTLPGGEDYREIIVTKPNVYSKADRDDISKSIFGIKYENLFPKQKADVDSRLGKKKTSVDDKDPHWDEENPQFWVRMNNRKWKNKTVAFMEEAQKAKTLQEDAFKKGWQIPATKKALLDAVDRDADVFAWINGAQTSERYKLSTQVEKVEWKPSDGKSFEVVIEPKQGSRIELDVKQDGTIRTTSVSRGDWKGKRLDEVLGKGMADSIMSKKSGTLEGDGLNFGGEWANNLYDRQVRDIVKKLTGAEVKQADMGLGTGGKTQFITKKGSQFDDLLPEDLKKGLEIETPGDKKYIITDVLGNGKFKAVPKRAYDNQLKNWKYTLETPDGKVLAKADDMKALVSAKKANPDAVLAGRNPINNQKEFIDRFSVGKEQAAMDVLISRTAYKQTDAEIAQQFAETFDISTPTQTQQYIELTPEVKAKIKSEAPKLKMKNPSAGEALPLIFLLLGGGAVATQG